LISFQILFKVSSSNILFDQCRCQYQFRHFIGPA
jgi:hypothetical protein